MIDGARDSLHADALAYPLFLDLQIAYWEAIKKRHDTPKPEDFKVTGPGFQSTLSKDSGPVVARLWRGSGNTRCNGCGVADRFDKLTFGYVIDKFGTGLAKDAFDRLAGLSFVSADEADFLTLHRAIRDALRSSLEARIAAGKPQLNLLEHYEPRAAPPSLKRHQ